MLINWMRARRLLFSMKSTSVFELQKNNALHFHLHCSFFSFFVLSEHEVVVFPVLVGLALCFPADLLGTNEQIIWHRTSWNFTFAGKRLLAK